MSKLALGTVQLGMNYGVSNKIGKVSFREAAKIIEAATKSNIQALDTAISYGSSEEVLGKIGVSSFDIITKLPPLPDNCENISVWVENHIEASINRLNIDSLYCIMLHKSDDLIGTKGDELLSALTFAKSRNLVHKIGISIYNPSELDKILDLSSIDLVQAPLNLIDRRLITSGWLQKLHTRGIEVHTRSAFFARITHLCRDKIFLLNLKRGLLCGTIGQLNLMSLMLVLWKLVYHIHFLFLR